MHEALRLNVNGRELENISELKFLESNPSLNEGFKDEVIYDGRGHCNLISVIMFSFKGSQILKRAY